MQTLLSIITVNFNDSVGLRKTVESVICQTFNNYEYIIIDGASTDGGVEIIKNYAGEFAYWVSEPDSGVYEAMNKGIRMANGKYLLFLNSGDFFVNAKVLENVFSKNHNADILTGQCNISENGKVVHTTNPPSDITFGYLYNTGLNHQSTFIKKKLFNKYGLYREDFKYNSDVDFWFRIIILNNVTIEKVPVIICDYNLDGISTKECNTETYKKELEEIFSNQLFQKFIPDYKSWNSERESMKVMYWVKSKKNIYKFLLFIYNIAVGFTSIKKIDD